MRDYTYKCKKCGSELVERFNAYDPDLAIPLICDQCGGEAILVEGEGK